jgi:phage shock protein A
MFGRIVRYVKTWFGGKIEAAMDPGVEIQSAIDEAKSRDRVLRNQAAKVIAHRTKLDARLEDAAEAVGEARETTKQALIRSDEATKGGDAETAAKWEQIAEGLALKLQAAESNLASLEEQFVIADTQADDAKSAVQQNAARLQELAAKRIELLGRLEQAKMQETVNEALESMSAAIDTDGPSLSRVETKIQDRLAEAQARAELRASTPEGVGAGAAGVPDGNESA